jgi:hypothetical protein
VSFYCCRDRMPSKWDIPRRDGPHASAHARDLLGGTFCEQRLLRDDARWRRARDLSRFMDRWRRRQASDYDDSDLSSLD